MDCISHIYIQRELNVLKYKPGENCYYGQLANCSLLKNTFLTHLILALIIMLELKLIPKAVLLLETNELGHRQILAHDVVPQIYEREH